VSRRRAWRPVGLGVMAAFLVATAMPARPAELGRLFFSPEQRRAMEAARVRGPRSTDAERSGRSQDGAGGRPSTIRTEPAIVDLPPPIVTGYVHRSSGNDTLWVNQQPQYRPAER